MWPSNVLAGAGVNLSHDATRSWTSTSDLEEVETRTDAMAGLERVGDVQPCAWARDMYPLRD